MRLPCLRDELRRRDEKLKELRRERDDARELVTEMREHLECQSASNRDPGSASKRDPLAPLLRADPSSCAAEADAA